MPVLPSRLSARGPSRPRASATGRPAALLPGLLATLVAGCAPELHPSVTDTRATNPLIRFADGGDDGPRDVPVNEIRVVPEDGGEWDYRHPAWCVTLEAGSYQPLASVRYGERPFGFDRCGGPAALKPGHRYLVSVSGAGTVGKVEFTAGR